MRFLFHVPLLLALSLFVRTAEAGQASTGTRVRFERLAAQATHFATNEIIHNRWSEERRWPVGLLEEQQHVLEELRAARLDRGVLLTLLEHANPRIRTLALAALFLREVPHDLPLIARLVPDGAATFPLPDPSLNSMGGRLPLSAFESAQTVGMVASAMIRS